MSESTSLNSLFSTIGTNAERPDAVDKVEGKAVFGADIYRPNMLHARLLGSPHAKLVILVFCDST